MNTVGEGSDSTWRQAQCEPDGSLGFFHLSLHLVEVGNLGKLVGIHEHGLSCVHGAFVFLEYLAELLAVKVLVASLHVSSLLFPSVFQSYGLVEYRLFGC